MKTFIRILIPALSYAVVGLLLSLTAKSNDKEALENLEKEHIVVKLPRIGLWVGYAGVGFCLISGLLMALSKNETAVLWVWIVMALFLLLSVFLIVSTLVWKIDIFRSEDYFIRRSSFFRTHKIFYSDCVSYKVKKNGVIIKTIGRSFSITSLASNIEFFMAMLVQHGVPEID
ncbi:MAG: hypothetical protein J5756_02005 [Clostridia bacterium]|nr:hypothetical protein [Clostridia bacterium]MBR5769640.1 hypothetical protein [Clostridia bacterium]